jgi:hypothetical protein
LLAAYIQQCMVGLGVLYTPLKDVVATVTPGYFVVVASVVLAMISSGYFVGRFMNMYPSEAAIFTGCHSGLGRTGNVAIRKCFFYKPRRDWRIRLKGQEALRDRLKQEIQGLEQKKRPYREEILRFCSKSVWPGVLKFGSSVKSWRSSMRLGAMP